MDAGTAAASAFSLPWRCLSCDKLIKRQTLPVRQDICFLQGGPIKIQIENENTRIERPVDQAFKIPSSEQGPRPTDPHQGEDQLSRPAHSGTINSPSGHAI